jgi:hypothetical protein
MMSKIFDDESRFPRRVPTPLVVAKHIKNLMDNAIRIPFTNKTIGLDAIIGTVPIAGDIITALPTLYLIVLAYYYQAPAHIHTKMWGNLAVDVVLGVLPIVGDVADAFFKSNMRNYDLLMSHLEAERPDLFIREKSYVPPTTGVNGKSTVSPQDVMVDIPFPNKKHDSHSQRGS